MKGHMQDGKFHPHTEHKGVRKSRDQKAKTQGIRFAKQRSMPFKMNDRVVTTEQCFEDVLKGDKGKIVGFDKPRDLIVVEFDLHRGQQFFVPKSCLSQNVRKKRDFVMSELDDFTLDRRIEMLQNAEMHVETVKQVDGVTDLEGIKKLLKESKVEKKNRTDNPKTQSQLRDFIAEKFNEEIPDQTFGFPFRDVNFRDIEKTGKNKWKFIIALASNDDSTVPQLERIGFKNIKINKVLDTKWATFEGDLGLG